VGATVRALVSLMGMEVVRATVQAQAKGLAYAASVAEGTKIRATLDKYDEAVK